MIRKLTMMLAAALAAALPLMADTETVGGYTWAYGINGDTAGIYGASTHYYVHGRRQYQTTPCISPAPTGALAIPSMLGGKPLTSIGSYAFYYCRGLTSVTIPDGVTSIGYFAFDHCSGLTSVTIPASVTSIDDFAFNGCTSLTAAVHITDIAAWCRMSFSRNPPFHAYNLYLNGSLVSDVTIPDGVTSIGDRAFYSCSGLTSVTIPDSVTSIGDYAFSGCSG